MGGQSVEYVDAPKASGIVRAINGPGLQMVTPTEVILTKMLNKFFFM